MDIKTGKICRQFRLLTWTSFIVQFVHPVRMAVMGRRVGWGKSLFFVCSMTDKPMDQVRYWYRKSSLKNSVVYLDSSRMNHISITALRTQGRKNRQNKLWISFFLIELFSFSINSEISYKEIYWRIWSSIWFQVTIYNTFHIPPYNFWHPL